MTTQTDVGLWPVYEFRPRLENYLSDPWWRGRTVYRFAGGDWVEDDGEYDIAFAIPAPGALVIGIEIPYQRNILWRYCKRGLWGSYTPEHPNGNAWHYHLRDGEEDWGGYWDHDHHLNHVAYESGFEFCRRMGNTAINGTAVDFDVRDPTIAAGLVRERATAEVVTFPDTFNCMFCGPLDWRAIEEAVS